MFVCGGLNLSTHRGEISQHDAMSDKSVWSIIWGFLNFWCVKYIQSCMDRLWAAHNFNLFERVCSSTTVILWFTKGSRESFPWWSWRLRELQRQTMEKTWFHQGLSVKIGASNEVLKDNACMTCKIFTWWMIVWQPIKSAQQHHNITAQDFLFYCHPTVLETWLTYTAWVKQQKYFNSCCKPSKTKEHTYNRKQ